MLCFTKNFLITLDNISFLLRHQTTSNTTEHSNDDKRAAENTAADSAENSAADSAENAAADVSIDEDSCSDEVVIQNKDKLGRQQDKFKAGIYI